MTPLYQKELLALTREHKHIWANILKNKKYRYIYDDILKNIPLVFKDAKTTISTKVWCYLYEDLDNFQWPVCKICGQKLLDIHASIYDGFKPTCKSKDCYVKQRALTQQNTLKERYGVVNVSQLDFVKDKVKQTNLEHYGSENPFAFGTSRYRQALLDKYGVDNPMKAESIKEKIKKTNLERYSVEYSFQSDAVKQKIKQTSLEHFGVENGGGSQQAIEKIKAAYQKKCKDDPEYKDKLNKKRIQTSLQHYGVEYPAQSKVVKAKYAQTIHDKFGCSNYTTYASYQMLCSSEFFEPLFSIDEYDNAEKDDELHFRCKKCGNEFTSLRRYGNLARCYDCYPKLGTSSQAEHEIKEFVESLLPAETVEACTKKIISPYELDIYVPSRKLAIEYDGLYWHSADSKEKKDYHLDKTLMCEKLGIQLIHVFENEWLLKRDIVCSRLKSLFGKFDCRIFARKCTIKSVDKAISRSFQEANHLQGYAQSSVDLGLFFDNELISLMTFSKTRFSKKYEWELVRFCNKLGFHVPGAAGKLLRHFEKAYHPKSLVSYADRRWSIGKLYESLGFSLIHNSPPNYWYFKANTIMLESRLKYQKHRLSKLLENFDENKTEIQNMLDNNYRMIYDCGNKVYARTYEECT